MVNRDDLPDGGAKHVAETVRQLRAAESALMIEALVGDFGGDQAAIDTVLGARPDVFAHNVEVVQRISRHVRDARCDYVGSLQVLRHASRHRAQGMLVKSSLMVGAGERDDEVQEALADLRAAGVDVVTIGQYLRPSAKHLAVDRYVEPSRFDAYRKVGERMGFRFVASGPLVRSSYRAAEAFLRAARPG
jgi:lipoic acid synthetase